MKPKNFHKSKIVLDFDDTMFMTCTKIIDKINKKYNIKKSIEDLRDWSYLSICPDITQKEILSFYEEEDLFKSLQPCFGLEQFILEFADNYSFLICSLGTKRNIELKNNFLEKYFNSLPKKNIDWEFLGVPIDENDPERFNKKSTIDFSDCLFAVDDNMRILASINTPKKILFDSGYDFRWSKPTVNENIYVINDFFDLAEMCRFDLYLRNGGIIIG